MAIGCFAGQVQQGANAIAIGYSAARLAQGNHSIASGGTSGYGNQHANTIILSATGTAVSSTYTNQFIVKPLQNNESITTLKNLNYDTVFGEITYSSIPTYS